MGTVAPELGRGRRPEIRQPDLAVPAASDDSISIVAGNGISTGAREPPTFQDRGGEQGVPLLDVTVGGHRDPRDALDVLRLRGEGDGDVLGRTHDAPGTDRKATDHDEIRARRDEASKQLSHGSSLPPVTSTNASQAGFASKPSPS